MCSSRRGELAMRSWVLKGFKVSVDKTKENNYEIYHLIIANILFNLNSCNIILCRYYQKVLTTLCIIHLHLASILTTQQYSWIIFYLGI